MNSTPHLSAVCGELALASWSWKLCASETPVFTMKNTHLYKKHQFLQWNLHLWWALSGELALASLWWGWLWWLGSAKLAPWISPKIKCKKKSAPLCGEMRKKNENGFWAAPALVGLVWQAKLEISMLPKHQFLQYKTKLYFLNTHFYNEF